MKRIAILGATGYTAVELIHILLRHPHVTITVLTSREDKRRVDEVHPSLIGRLEISLENPSPAEIAARADVAFCCLPHCASATVIPELLQLGMKVIDLSADYRLDSPAVFEKWYGEKHPDPNRLGKVPYGLPELFRSELKTAVLVANPGCYPTSVILPVFPLLKERLIEPTDIIVDSKSGVSGAGRALKLGSLYSECNESISAYGLGTHRHTPEIEQYLSVAAGEPVSVIFTPHLTPMYRGILTVSYLKPRREGMTAAKVLDVLRQFYRDEPFVHITEQLPATKNVSGTNFCHITARMVKDRILTVSVIDNLVKGASGAAVQNFNVLCGYPETTGF